MVCSVLVHFRTMHLISWFEGQCKKTRWVTFHNNIFLQLSHPELCGVSIEFSLNVFNEFAEFSDKIFVVTIKRFEPVTSCVRDQDATSVPARHVRDRIIKLRPVHTSVIYQIP